MAITQEQVQHESIGIEQAQDAAYLANLAGQEPPLPGAEPEPEPQPSVTPEQSLAGVLQIAGMAGAVMGYPSVAEVWNGAACAGFAEKAVPVLRKYAWGARILEFLENGSGIEEMALLMYSAPLVLATVSAARKDAAALAEKAGKKPEPEQPAQVARSESPEMPEVHEIANS